MRRYDVVVIGTGPAGQKSAIQAAKLGKEVLIIERESVVGGAQVNTGTIPSKALREAVIHLSGYGQRRIWGERHEAKRRVTFDDLLYYCGHIVRGERDVVNQHLSGNGVELAWGTGKLIDANTVQIERAHGPESVHADNIVLATGTSPARPSHVPFDDERIVDSDTILSLKRLPKSMIIVGGGVIGTEYACMLSLLGVRVILVEARDRLLDFADSEITEAMQYHMRSQGITLRLGEAVAQIGMLRDGTVEATLVSGKHLRAETLLYCVGRQGNTEGLGLESVGINPDSRGRLKVDEFFRTEVPNIYAAGDVVGWPSLASASMEQGRMASCHACGVAGHSMPELFPIGIYAIPEISMVGKTEAQLTAEGIPYEAGVAQYREIARGLLLGDDAGMLKMLIHEETREILGVHAIGTGATELIHIGQTAIAFKAKVDYFIESVFNYPTLAECYKVAALNGSNKLRSLHDSRLIQTAEDAA